MSFKHRSHKITLRPRSITHELHLERRQVRMIPICPSCSSHHPSHRSRHGTHPTRPSPLRLLDHTGRSNRSHPHKTEGVGAEILFFISARTRYIQTLKQAQRRRRMQQPMVGKIGSSSARSAPTRSPRSTIGKDTKNRFILPLSDGHAVRWARPELTRSPDSSNVSSVQNCHLHHPTSNSTTSKHVKKRQYQNEHSTGKTT